SLFLSLFLSVFSIFSVFLSVCLFLVYIKKKINSALMPHTHHKLTLSFCLSVCLSVCVSVCLSFCVSSFSQSKICTEIYCILCVCVCVCVCVVVIPRQPGG